MNHNYKQPLIIDLCKCGSTDKPILKEHYYNDLVLGWFVVCNNPKCNIGIYIGEKYKVYEK